MTTARGPFIALCAFTVFFLMGAFVDKDVAAADSMSSGNLRSNAVDLAKKLIGKRKTELENLLKRRDISSDERDRLKKEYDKLEKNLDRYAAGFSSLWDAMDGVRTGIKNLDQEARLGYKIKNELNLSWHAAKSLKDAGFVTWWNMADKGVSFVANLQKVNDNLKLADNLGKSGPGRSIARNLSLMTSAMSWFGDKIPLIGPFIKTYGDVGAQMLNGIYALDQQIQKSEGGQLIDGVHGYRKVMLEKLRLLHINSASQLEGLKDVYTAHDNGGQLVIWNKDGEKFLLLKGLQGGAGEITVRNRYLQLAKAGQYNPTAMQIANFKSVIVLSFAEAVFEVPPGQVIQFTPAAKFAEVAPGTTRQVAAHPLVVTTIPAGAGKFMGSPNFRIGQTFQWKAPETADEKVQFVVNLAPEVRSVVHPIKPFTTSVYTASPTTVRLEASATTVAPGQRITVRGIVYDSAGKSIPHLKSADMKIKADWYQGLSQSTSTADMTGEQVIWRAPTTPGTYNITASFTGGHVSGWISNSSYLASSATLPITVRPFQYTIATDASANLPVTALAPATVNVSITNQEPTAVKFTIGLKEADEQRLWTVGPPPEQFDIPPGQTLAFPIQVSLKDVAKAAHFALRISAEPMEAKPGKHVHVKFRNDDPNAAVNQIAGCNAVAHQECRGKVDAEMDPQMAQCVALGESTPKGFTCAMEVTVRGTDARKKCAADTQCEFSKKDDEFAKLAKKRLLCLRQNAGGNISKCMVAGNDIPICDQTAYGGCEFQARTYYEKTAQPYCSSKYDSGSCNWFRCRKEIAADYEEKKLACAEKNLCDGGQGLVQEGMKSRTAAQCIAKNEYDCKSCLTPAEAAQNETYVSAETLKREALVKNPPPEPTSRETLVSHLPVGVLSVLPTLTKMTLPSTTKTPVSPGSQTTVAPPNVTTTPPATEVAPPTSIAVIPPGAADNNNGPPADPSIGANMGAPKPIGEGSGTPRDPWTKKKRPKRKVGGKYNFRWNKPNDSLYRAVKLFYRECMKNSNCTVRGFRSCYQIAGPKGKIVVCEAQMIGGSDASSERYPMSVDIAWRKKKK